MAAPAGGLPPIEEPARQPQEAEQESQHEGQVVAAHASSVEMPFPPPLVPAPSSPSSAVPSSPASSRPRPLLYRSLSAEPMGSGVLASGSSLRFQPPRLPHRSGKHMPRDKASVAQPSLLPLPPSPTSKESDPGGHARGADPVYDVLSTPSLLQSTQESQRPSVTGKGALMGALDVSITGTRRSDGQLAGPLRVSTSQPMSAFPRRGGTDSGEGEAPRRGFRKQYAPLTECGFGVYHRLRLPAILLVDSIEWDGMTLVMVLFNALCLAFFRPTDASYSSLSLTIQFFEIVCQICFTYEAIVKLAALGVVRYKLSYFRDPWNVFDFVVLVAGWLALYAFFTTISDDTSTLHGPLTVFGVIRVLRPLRVLKMLPELRRLTGAVLLALPQLLTLASLALLVFTTLAVVGLQLLGGKLNQQCYKPIGDFYQDAGPVLKLCSTSGDEGGGRACPADYVCQASPEAPNEGFTSFDSVPLAYLTIFQCMTQEGWSDVMYWARQATGRYIYAYFTVILFLSFFLFNLIVVFIIVNYSLSQEQTAFDSIKDRQPALPPSGGDGRYRRSSVAGGDPSSFSSDYSELLISKLLAIKAGSKLELLTSNAAAAAAAGAAPREGPTETPSQPQPPDGSVSGRIAEIALLLQRALRHLQLAPQNTLGRRYFRLPRADSDSDSDDGGDDDDRATYGDAARGADGRRGTQPLLKGRGRSGGLSKDPARVSFEESPGTYICASLARSPMFNHFMNLMTLVSTILLAMAHHGMEPSTAATLRRLDNVLVLVFTLEALVKIRGLGWRRFKADGLNTFDLLVVVVSILELFLGADSPKSYALRCVRLLRIFSLARNWHSFRRVLFNMAYTASNSLPFLLLTTIFLFVFAIGGMTFMGGKLKEIDPLTGLEVPVRANFDSFYWAVISVFRIMTLDDWDDDMYEAMDAAEDIIAAVFFVSAVLLGKYVLLNLLVAILVENYSSLQGDEGDRRRLLEDRLGAQSSLLRYFKAPLDCLCRCKPGQRPSSASVAGRTSAARGQLRASDSAMLALHSAHGSVLGAVRHFMRGPTAALRPSSFLRVESLPSSRTVGGYGGDGQGDTSLKGPAGATHGPPPSGAGGGEAVQPLAPSQSLGLTDAAYDDDDDPQRHSGTSTAIFHWCCAPWVRRLRVLDEALLWLYEHDWFPFAMILVIISSCVVLALDCPGADGTGPSPRVRIVVEAWEALLIGAMAFEQVYRVKSLGGVWTYDGSYLTRLWDWFDLFVILSALVALCIPYPTAAAIAANAPIAQAVMAAKVARGFRPITLIPRINGLTVVVDTLGQALRACSGVLSVLAVFYLLFGILGVGLFSGSFYSCNDPERTCFPYTPGAFEGSATMASGAASDGTETMMGLGGPGAGFSCPLTQACVGKYYDVATASMVDREWRNPSFSPEGSSYSFDNLPAALLTLFEVATLELWGQIMYTACDVVGPGRAPVRNANPGAALFFMCFLFIVCFFVQEIFVAVIIDNFKRLRSISNGSAFMTAQQREWVRLQRAIKSRQPRIQAVPTQCLRLRAYRLVTHRYFDPCVVLMVALNVMGMLTYHYPQSQAWVRAQWTVDNVFTFVYLAEAGLRIMAHGPHDYLTGAVSRWHPYDALVATWGLLYFCLGPIAQASVFCLVALRLGRTLRLFRVIRHSTHLQRLCRIFYFSLPSLKNIGMFLLLIYYIYAVGGTHLFATVPTGTFINEDANFSSFGLALLTLVRCTAGEDWNGLMHEADQATASTRGKMAVLYFCSFMILISYVALNLFVATMLENFQEDMASVGGVIATKHIRAFSQLWTELKTKSLRGDLTKINNRAARFALSGKRKSIVRFLPATATPPMTPSADTEPAAAVRLTALRAADSSSFRRVSIRDRLGGAFARSVSSGKMLAAAAAVTRQKAQRSPVTGPIHEEEEGDRPGVGRSPTVRFGHPSVLPPPPPSPQQQQEEEEEEEEEEAAGTVLGEDEEALVFLRLYESSPRYLPVQYLGAFLVGLPPPLGPKGCFGNRPLTAGRLLAYLRSLEVPVNQYSYVYYQDVLQAVLRRAFELQTHIPQAMRMPFKNQPVFLAHEWYAAVAVQSAWRGRALRSKLRSSPDIRRDAAPQPQRDSSSRRSSASLAGLPGVTHLRISIGGSAGADGPGGRMISGAEGSLAHPRRASTVTSSSPTNSSGSAVSPHQLASPRAIMVDDPSASGPAPRPSLILPSPPVSPSHHQRRPTSHSRASRVSSVASVAETGIGGRPSALDGSGRRKAPSIAIDSSSRHRRPVSQSDVGMMGPAVQDQPPQRQSQDEQAGAEGAAGHADQEEVLAKMLALAKLGDDFLVGKKKELDGGGEEVDLAIIEMLTLADQERERGRSEGGGGTAQAHEVSRHGGAEVEGDSRASREEDALEISEIRRRAESV